MRILLTLAIALTLSLSAACGGPSCDKVVDHMMGLLPAEMKPDDAAKTKMVADCEKETNKEQRQCVLDAKDLEAVMKCDKGK